jgi:hypothetical protein
MGIQRNTRITEQVAQTLEMYADLVEGGMDPNLAVEQVANALQGQQQQTTLGNTADTGDIAGLVNPDMSSQGAPMMEGGSPQAAQAGINSQDFGLDMM